MACSEEKAGHTPVLLAQVLESLNVRPGGTYLDATFGRGGHAGAILGRLGTAGRLVCMDRDPAAFVGAEGFAADERVSLQHSPFSRLDECADRVRPGLCFDGILFDLGVSSPQLDQPSRGFSFLAEGPLDMRMNPQHGPTAADLVNHSDESGLSRIFMQYGEERHARRIARAIVAQRRLQPLRTTLELANLIARVVPGRDRHKHPATRVFQALRIAVNRELDELRQGLDRALERLCPLGRLAVISFHSLEDRMVKRFMREHSQVDPMYAGLPQIPPQARPKLRLVGRSVEPTAEEVSRNPRARSARLRVAERLPMESAT